MNRSIKVDLQTGHEEFQIYVYFKRYQDKFFQLGQLRNVWIPVRRICVLKIFELKVQDYQM